MENLHEFFTGDRLFLNQERRNLIKLMSFSLSRRFASHKKLKICMTSLSIFAAVISLQFRDKLFLFRVLIFLAFQTHQTELLGHTVLGYHRTRDPGCFFNII